MHFLKKNKKLTRTKVHFSRVEGSSRNSKTPFVEKPVLIGRRSFSTQRVSAETCFCSYAIIIVIVGGP